MLNQTAVNASRPTAAPESGKAGLESPLPLAQFKRFLVIFHGVFAGGLVFVLWLRFARATFEWGWADAALVALMIVQLGLYARFFVFPTSKTLQRPWFLGYFAASYGIWFVEWRLEPAFEWVCWAYMGQMFGSMQPRISVPVSLAVFALYFGNKLGWSSLKALHPSDLLGGGWLVAGVLAFGLFLHRLATTSSERARLIEQLKNAQRELEAARERDAELARLRERERLARELHDSLGHGLVTLSVQLEAVERLIPADPAKASKLLGQMKELTRGSMEQLRRSLAGMRAPGLGDRRLPQAVAQLCADTRERSGLSVTCQLPENAPALPREVEEALWRSAQEAVWNAERHANAREIKVSVSLTNDRAVLQVIDDGIGIPADAEQRNGHYGLRGLRERVEGLGGTLEIVGTTPGTKLEARIPLIPEAT